MRDLIEDRVIEVAEYIVDNDCTVRAAATKFGISKSTVHMDMTVRLREYDIDLFCAVKKVLDYNFSVRHIRGGESTRKTYERKRIMYKK